MSRLSPYSLQVRLVAFVLLVIAPAFGIILYTGMQQRAYAEETIRDNAIRTTQIITTYQEQMILRTFQVMKMLATEPSVHALDGTTCSQQFATVLADYPFYTYFGVANADGTIICNSTKQTLFPINTDVSAYDWFVRSVDIRKFVVSDVLRYNATDATDATDVADTQLLIQTFGYPLYDDNNNLIAVLTAGLDVHYLNTFAIKAQLPPDSIVTMIDSNGTVLARYPKTDAWVNQTIPDAPLIRTMLAQKGDGTAQLVGLDGVSRLYAFAYLRYSEQGLYVSVGIPEIVAFGKIDELVNLSLSLLAFFIVVEITMAMVGGKIFIMKPISCLFDATTRLAKGELDVRVDSEHGVGELRPLAIAFNRMATTIQRHEENLREAENRYRMLVEYIPTVIYTFDYTNRKFTYISPRIMQLAGYHAESCIGSPTFWQTFIHPDDRAFVQEQMQQSIDTGESLALEYRIMLHGGAPLWVRDDAVVVSSGKQNTVLLQGTLLDISRRKHAEETIEAQQETMRELSTPILHIGKQVMLMPLIGNLDTRRANQMMQTLLEGIKQHRARIIILDITGMPFVDTQVANALIQTEQASRLLGAHVIFTGVRPEVAQTLVGLGIELGNIKTYSTLQTGIDYVLQQNKKL